MKKIIAILMSAVMVFGMMSMVSFAAEDEKKVYPYVFVHGMMGWGDYDGINDIIPYWGIGNGNLIDQLNEQGIECYAASVGKISSYWDRACELYAQLTGTVVDYGEAHSEAHNHLRYGRSYENNKLMDTFGQTDENGDIIKINLIGHSMGGPTIRLFTWLLENGAADEVARSGENVSEFFKGGKGNYVNAVITMSAPHNGTPASNILYDDFPTAYMLSIMGNLIGSTSKSSFWDFQLEQFGLTSVPSQGIKARLNIKGIKALVKSDDNCGYDLSIRGSKALNDMIDTVDGVYYFSYTGEKANARSNGMYSPPIDMFPLFTPFAYIMGHLDGDVYDGVALGEEWRLNDGMVPVISGSAPLDEASVYYNDVKDGKLETGVWHIMPLLNNFSHVSYMGMDKDISYADVYYNAIEIVNSL